MAASPRALTLPFSRRAAWGALAGAALALIAYQSVHRATPTIQLEPRPTITVIAPGRSPAPGPSASRASTPPSRTSPGGAHGTAPGAGAAPSSPVPLVVPISHSTTPTPILSSSPTTPKPIPSATQSASPSPTPPGGSHPPSTPPSAPLPLTVTAAITVPGRSTPLLAARASITTPAAPPFPAGATAQLIAIGIKATITLP